MTTPAPAANQHVSRRTVLRGAAGAATSTVALGVAAPATAQESSEPDYGDWFKNVGNYDGTVDKTGQAELTITVGSEGNNGSFAFSPAAVRVDPGTTVTWEWSGKGGVHNVAAEDGSFESEMTDEAGFTFEQTFDETEIVKYACVPHKSMGMKGAVVVGNPPVGSGSELTDMLAIGGGIGLTGVLFAMFIQAVRGGSSDAPRRHNQ